MFDLAKKWVSMSRLSLGNEIGATDFSALQSDAVTYIAEKTLMVAKKIVRFYEAAGLSAAINGF